MLITQKLWKLEKNLMNFFKKFISFSILFNDLWGNYKAIASLFMNTLIIQKFQKVIIIKKWGSWGFLSFLITFKAIIKQLAPLLTRK